VGQDPSPLTGLYLAQTAARSGGAKQVPAYLAPFIDSIAAKTDPDQIQIALKTLLEVSETSIRPTPSDAPGKLDKLDKSYRRDPALLDLLEKSAGRMRYRRQEAAACNLYRLLLERDPDRKVWIDAVELEQKLNGEGPADKLLAYLQDKATPSSSAPARKAGARSARAAPPPPSPPSRKASPPIPTSRACAGCCSTPT
jgi:hypothetical protein